jgi:hypothetical protein
MMELPTKICDAFNLGNLGDISSLVNSYCVPDCIFKSEASIREEHGRHRIFTFIEALYEDFPDGVLIVKDIQLVDKFSIKFRTYFSGTREQPPAFGEENLVYTKGTYVDHIKFSRYSPEDVLRLVKREKQLRDSGRPIQIVAKGETKYILDANCKIVRYEAEYNITDFCGEGETC